MAIIRKPIFISIFLIILVLCNGCLPLSSTLPEEEHLMETETPKMDSTLAVNNSIVTSIIPETSKEFQISDQVENPIFKNNILYFRKSVDPQHWYEYDFSMKQIKQSTNLLEIGQELVDDITENTIRKPDLSDFYPSPTYEKVLFAESLDSIRATIATTTPTITQTPTSSNSLDWVGGESLTISEPLVFTLYVYDVKTKGIVNLGRFFGDIGIVLWSDDENTIVINRDSRLVYDYLSPYGNWIVDLSTGTVKEIKIDDGSKSEIFPLLISNDSSLLIYEHTDWRNEPGIRVADFKHEFITFLPINEVNKIWWLSEGARFAYLSPCDNYGFYQVKGFDLLNNLQIQSYADCFTANLSSSKFLVSNSGKFIVYQHFGSTILYWRTITLSP